MRKHTIFTGTALLMVSFCIYHLLTWRHLEITDATLFSAYRTASFVFFGLLLILLIISAPNDYSGTFSTTLVITTVLCAGLLWVALIIFYPFPYARKDAKVLYIDKQYPNRRIVEQITYAGALGSDRHDTIIVKQLMNNVRWRNETEVSEIDRKAWMPFNR